MKLMPVWGFPIRGIKLFSVLWGSVAMPTLVQAPPEQAWSESFAWDEGAVWS